MVWTPSLKHLICYKTVFQIHGSDGAGHPLLRKRLRRAQVLPFFTSLPPCLIGLEACGSAHYWAQELTELGHEVKLIAPQFVKPFFKTINAEMIWRNIWHTRKQAHIALFKYINGF